MPFSVVVAMATVKPEGLTPPIKYFFKTVIILNYHVKFQVYITNIKEKVSARRCLALIQHSLSIFHSHQIFTISLKTIIANSIPVD